MSRVSAPHHAPSPAAAAGSAAKRAAHRAARTRAVATSAAAAKRAAAKAARKASAHKRWVHKVIAFTVVAAVLLGAFAFFAFKMTATTTTPAPHASFLVNAYSEKAGVHDSVTKSVALALREDIFAQDTVGFGRLATVAEVEATAPADTNKCQWSWTEGGGAVRECSGAWQTAEPSQIPEKAGVWLLMNAPTSTQAREIMYNMQLGVGALYPTAAFVSAKPPPS